MASPAPSETAAPVASPCPPIDAAFGRRSVRVFQNRVPSKEDIAECVRAACLAPSGHNKQPWRYYVYRHENALVQRVIPLARERCIATFHTDFRKLAESCGVPYNEVDPIFYQAPVVIFVTACGGLPGLENMDCGLSMENFFLAAERRGLSTCPIGLAATAAPEIMEELNKLRGPLDASHDAKEKIAEKQQKYTCAFVLGYADAEHDVQQKRQPRNFNKVVFADQF
ncbi:putative Nitroreductase family [Paratrimastix pyriformis]|uniref:Nitroreductase family n=1 Tax=Paratrimastix pyriformis TaxID=342808 RepID=A0ABQ8URP8_9EUKA|nr:putative Nitroreductase family [Paratrimastix pyriformis]|eukprot:GAFH01004680.1.p1 GENE.GAFH01004680.1~~GAFH01004680.1.p1  ORF type:complete len:243 (-),score=42.10 GAFH01004680.1:22-699(-)